jgi:nucleotide-binding universal stress UspA family protein
MAYRDILVHVRPGRDAAEPGFRQALALAAAHGARLTALVYESEAEPLNVGGMMVLTPAGQHAGDATTANATAQLLTGAAEQAGVPIEIIRERSFLYGVGESLADVARVRDITLLTVPETGEIGRRFMVEAALFQSGRPLLLVPRGAEPGDFRRILVGWDATPASIRAIHDALPILVKADDVILIRVTDDKTFRPGQSGVALAAHLARHGITCGFMEVSREGTPVATRFAAVAQEEKADLIVMGAYAHARIRDLIFGSATRDVVAGALPVAALLAT